MIPVAIDRDRLRTGCGYPALERSRFEDGIARHKGDEFAAAFRQSGLESPPLAVATNDLDSMVETVA
jgi:hypothetical protein